MISVVIPALNEEDAVADTVRGALRVLREAGVVPHEVIVVDDGSNDETGARAIEAGARLIRHPHRAGYGHALKSGIRDAQYDMIAITDADGTYPVERLPEMIALYQQGFDMVVGARSGKYYQESIDKMALRWVLRCLVEWVSSRSIPDINSGIRIFSRKTSMTYFDHLCNTFSFTTSITIAYMMTGKFVTYIPIDYYKRIGKTKINLLRDGARTAQYVFETAIYYNPLRIFILLSLIVVALSAISFIFAAMTKLHVLYLIGIGGIISSILVFSMGLLASLLRQIMVKTTASDSRRTD